MPIADIHAHIFPDKIAEKASEAIGVFYEVPINHVATFDILMEQERLAGIDYFTVSSSATGPAQVATINDYITACVAGKDGIIGFGTLYPTMDNWEPELEKIVAYGLRGIKIHSDFQKIDIDDPRSVDMYRGIAKNNLPVLFHMGDPRYDYSAPERLLHLLRQVPDLIVIAAHFGGYRAWDRAVKCQMPENVYYDTSSSLMFFGKERGQELMEQLGPHRFMFGSDYPMWTPGIELERFLELDLDDTTRQRILFGNYEQLFLK